MNKIRTDLAIENREMVSEKQKEIPGVDVKVQSNSGIKITDVEILDSKGSKIMDKPIGNYITLEFKDLIENLSKLSEEISSQITKLLKSKPTDKMTTLVVGLGNWNITPDALGPQVVGKLMVTKHLFDEAIDLVDSNMSRVCAIAPGVLGLTGIETSKIVKGIVEKTYPDLIIVIDALASRRLERVATSIQITDVGINPGSGVGNNRKALNKETLGIDVIAIGVPTVVDASTVANDAIDIVLDSMISHAPKGKEFYEMLNNINRDEKEVMIREVLQPFIGNLMVTPKEVDNMITDLSQIIADGINLALHPNMTLSDISHYVS